MKSSTIAATAIAAALAVSGAAAEANDCIGAFCKSTSADDGRHEWLMKYKLELFKEERDACDANPGSCRGSSRIIKDAKCVDGLADGTYPCKNADLAAFLPHNTIGGSGGATNSDATGNDIWGWVDEVSGKEYALAGSTEGTSIVDVTDPYNPVYRGILPAGPTGFNAGAGDELLLHNWRDIKIFENTMYVVSEFPGSAVQIFNLARLRREPLVPAAPEQFVPDLIYDLIPNAHNVYIHEETGYMYVVGVSIPATGVSLPGPAYCQGGLHIVDIRVPLEPIFAGCFEADGYTHDVQCTIYDGPDSRYTGKEVCFAYNEDSLTIVDVTDKTNIEVISKVDYVNWSYIHQGWATEDFKYLLMDDELDELCAVASSNCRGPVDTFEQTPLSRTIVMDIQDLEKPFVHYIHTSEEAAVDHNQYIIDGYSYQAQNSAGLRILDVTDVENQLTEVAYFDTDPNSDSPAFRGVWSIFKFPSGTVAVDSRKGDFSVTNGLFVIVPTLPERETENDTAADAEGLAEDVSVASATTTSSATHPGVIAAAVVTPVVALVGAAAAYAIYRKSEARAAKAEEALSQISKSQEA